MKLLALLLAATAALAQDYATQVDPAKISAIDNDIPHTLASCDYTPANSGALTSALSSVSCGQTICLTAGATYTGNFVYNKTCSSYVTMRSTQASDLTPGVRVLPSNATSMAKVVSPNGDGAIIARPNSSRLRLIGLEVTSTGTNSQFIVLGSNNAVATSGQTQVSSASVPHHFVIDRNYIHCPNASTKCSVGVRIDANYVAVVNSRIDEIHDGTGDDQAILIVNSEGGILVQNNRLEAAGENILIGGGDAVIPELVPRNIVFRGNYFWKNPARKNGDPLYKVKNLFELKTGSIVLVEGNVLENFWSGVQSQYFGVVAKTANQGANCRWDNGSYNQTSNITFRYNKLVNIAQGFVWGRVAACEKAYHGSEKFWIHDNLITGLGTGHTQDGAPRVSIWSYPQLDGSEYLYPRNVVFAHNTVASPVGFGLQEVRYTHLETAGNYVRDFYMHSNILPGRWFAAGTYNNVTTIQDRFRSVLQVKNNVFLAQSPAVFTTAPNYARTSYGGLFINESGGDYRLTTASAAAYPGMDGRPAGADIVKLDACTAGATTNWTGTCPGGTVGPSACPSQAVILSKASIPVGSNSVASAPAGWYGGTFTSSDTSKATLHAHAPTLWNIATGVAAGSTSITGAGWTAANGATNCSLSASSLTVTSVTSSKEMLVYDWNGSVQNSNPYTYAERNPGTAFQPQPVRGNFDWTASPNFDQGTYYVRLKLGCMTSTTGFDTSGFRLLFNHWQAFNTPLQAETNIPANTAGLNVTYTGSPITNTFTVPLSSFVLYSPGAGVWSWATQRDRVGFYTYPASVYGASLPASTVLDDDVYPYDLRLTVVAVNVAGGGTFSGWPTWIQQGLGERTYDCSFPTPVTITAPPSGQVITSPTDINVSASDNVGVTKVDYFVDEGPGSLKASDNLAPYSWRLDPTGYAAGSHTLTVRAWDLAGNTNSASIPFSIQSGPSLSATITANGSANPIMVTSGSSVTLAWSSTGAASCEARASTPYATGLWSGSRSTAGGSQVINPTASATYYLDCTGLAESSVSASVQVNVSGVCAQPPL